MNRRRMLLLMRIAFSALFVVVCGISTWFCVRSFYWADLVNARVHVIPVEILSAQNKLKITVPRIEGWNTIADGLVGAELQRFSSDEPQALTISSHLSGFGAVWGFGLYRSSNVALLVPHWFLIVVALALSGAPWLKWSYRFSLRTLLAITALVAFALAMLVVAFR
jgi:hypothetical protein